MEVVIPDRRESDGVGFIGRDNAAKTIGFHSFYVGAALAAKGLKRILGFVFFIAVIPAMFLAGI